MRTSRPFIRQASVQTIYTFALLLSALGAAWAGEEGTLTEAKPSSPECQRQAMHVLETMNADGERTVKRLQDKSVFAAYLNECANLYADLTTAVHESNHALTEQLDAYQLVSGELVKRPHEAERYFPAKEIAPELAKRLGTKDDTFKLYVEGSEGSASSTGNFLYFLDELNAYTHDLHSAVDLYEKLPRPLGQTYRNGLSSMMASTAAYFERARAQHPAQWAQMNREPMRSLLRKLWAQGEAELDRACSKPEDLGLGEDVHDMRYLCDPQRTDAVAALLSRPAACPAKCLR